MMVLGVALSERFRGACMSNCLGAGRAISAKTCGNGSRFAIYACIDSVFAAYCAPGRQFGIIYTFHDLLAIQHNSLFSLTSIVPGSLSGTL